MTLVAKSRRYKAAWVVLALLAIAAALYGLYSCSSDREESVSSTPDDFVSESASPVSFTAQARRIEASLGGSRREQESVLVPLARGAKWSSQNLLPKGATLTIDESTFVVDRKTGLASVSASVIGSVQNTFTVYLEKHGNKWLVLETTSPKKANANTEATNAVFAAMSRQEDPLDGCNAGLGAKTPVLMVHGFTSDQQVWSKEPDRMDSAISANANVKVKYFDYASHNRHWVTSPEVGESLAKYIDCLSQESLKGGGNGKVIVVAHSMGGLATRYAAAQEVDGRKVSDSLGLVITLGTPHNGSGYGTLCRYFVVEFGSCSGKAPKALATGSQELADLPAFPKDLPVRAIAGHVIQQKWRLFFIQVTRDLGGDKVVGVASATAQYTTFGKGDGRLVYKCYSESWLPDQDTASCEHNGLIGATYVQQGVINGINEYRKATMPAPKPTMVTTAFGGLRLQLDAGWRVETQHDYGMLLRSKDACADVDGKRRCASILMVSGDMPDAGNIPAELSDDSCFHHAWYTEGQDFESIKKLPKLSVDGIMATSYKVSCWRAGMDGTMWFFPESANRPWLQLSLATPQGVDPIDIFANASWN